MPNRKVGRCKLCENLNAWRPALVLMPMQVWAIPWLPALLLASPQALPMASVPASVQVPASAVLSLPLMGCGSCCRASPCVPLRSRSGAAHGAPAAAARRQGASPARPAG